MIEQRSYHRLNDFSALVLDLTIKDDHTLIALAGQTLFCWREKHLDCIAVLNRQMHAPSIHAEHGDYRAVIHAAQALQSARNGEYERTVSNGLLVRLLLAEFVVNVRRVVITREAGKIDDVGRGHGSTRRNIRLADFEIFVV